jgi:hypothetical protein
MQGAKIGKKAISAKMAVELKKKYSPGLLRKEPENEFI